MRKYIKENVIGVLLVCAIVAGIAGSVVYTDIKNAEFKSDGKFIVDSKLCKEIKLLSLFGDDDFASEFAKEIISYDRVSSEYTKFVYTKGIQWSIENNCL